MFASAKWIPPPTSSRASPPQARNEPGLEFFMVNQSTTNPAHFLFYEVFTDAAAFAAHQQTPHFRLLILEQALPLLDKRERVQYVPL
jgi:autoinducer 2-degrading protein